MKRTIIAAIAASVIAAMPLSLALSQEQPKPVSLEYYQQRVGLCDLQAAQLVAENATLRTQLDRLKTEAAAAPISPSISR